MTSPHDSHATDHSTAPRTPGARPTADLWRRSGTWRALFALGVCTTALAILFLPHHSNRAAHTAARIQASSAPSPARSPAPVVGIAPSAMTSPMIPQPAIPQIPNAAIIRADQNCPGGPLLAPPIAPPPVEAQVTGFVTRSQAMALIQENQQEVHGLITPQYINNQRANVTVGLNQSSQATVLVPEGMTVTSGETVTFVGGHVDPDLACHYIPNLIVHAFPDQGR